ncbi:MAG: methyl-accepting chemotaxis protein [Methylovirgula sp.]|uniref:methyl-accepting chemotaxis protein n=1 Tax=Methylovirgula sp. TaxID=1978224 RepID=UPI00307621DF
MGALTIGRSLILRQLLYIGILVAVSVVAYVASLQVRDLAHSELTASPAAMHVYAVQIDDAAAKLNRVLLFGSTLGCLLVLLISMPIAYLTVARPVDILSRQMSALAGGDVDIEISGTARKDEIGVISRSLQVLRDGVKKNNELVDELHARDDREKRLMREAAVRAKVEKFSADLSANVARLTEMTKRMSTASQDMISGARNAAEGSSHAKTASSNAAGDVSSVAVASEELLASIEEISRQVVQSTTVVKRAVSESIETSSGMARLTEAARRVGDIVSLISRIAAQTNLLALNATIEAARAGEAGRGFAVVAQEVKTLATQTARATQDISGQIADMQAATESSVTAIDTIQTKIGEIEQISAIIASAVQEQGASTQEIARNVRSAASGTTATSAYVENVAQAAALTSQHAESLVGLAGELDTLAAHVLSDVRAFGDALREAA